MVERRRKNNCQGSAASPAEEPKIGDAVPDGTIYAGLSRICKVVGGKDEARQGV
jgi:hypothetical protein